MKLIRCASAAALLCAGLSCAQAGTIFTENFDSYSSSVTGDTQLGTGYTVAYGGAITGWTGSGLNAIHAVETTAGDWTPMIYADNEISLDTGISANDSGTGYSLTFDYGTAVYQNPSQVTGSSDGLTIEILRADDSILATETVMPGAWSDTNQDLSAGLSGTLAYVGDGTGDVTIAILSANPSSNDFGGSIDNLSLASTPEPGSLFLLGPASGLLALYRRRAMSGGAAAASR
jgi:hypothetical protein